LDAEKGLKPPPLICIEPALIPIEGILPARVLSRVVSRTRETISATLSDVYPATRAPSSNAYVMLANFASETLTVPKATVLGLAEEVSEPLVNKVNSDPPNEPRKREKNEARNAFSHPGGKQRRVKRTPQPRKGNDGPKKSFMFRIEREPCPRATHGNALSRDAQVATVERRHEEKRAKHRKRRSRKRKADKHSHLIDLRRNERKAKSEKI